MQAQSPAASTVAAHSTVAPSLTVTVEPGSPEPDRVGVMSFVGVVIGAVSVGVAGATVSTMIVFGVEAGDVLPAGSV